MRIKRQIAGMLCAAMIVTMPGSSDSVSGLEGSFSGAFAGVADGVSLAAEWVGSGISEAADNVSDMIQGDESDLQTPEQTLEETVEDKKQELADNEGQYAEDSIVLENTSKEQAENIVSKIEGAAYRITEQEDFAVIYLPEGTSIDEVYEDQEMETLVPDMSPDYYVDATSLTEDARGRQLMAAKPDYEVNDTEYDMQQELSYVNMKDTWKTTKGAGVTVAVIDTGIDTDNPEFEGRISQYSYNASHDKIVKDYDISVIEDEQGHGTAVAGTLAAGMDGKGIVGVAPEAEILVIKCDCDASGAFLRGSDLVFGLAYAIERDVDVINMSFGTSVNIFEKYTKLAVDSDIICVAAAGNDGSSMPSYPAADENVIGVGAMAGSDWEIAGYSNYGDNSELVAPGTVYTTDYKGGYKVETGTSLSSPVVAGAVALYLAGNKRTEYKDMAELLQASSTDIGIPGEDWTYGYGALDINALVCEEKGTITYEMLTDELENRTQVFVKGHTLQIMPEPERENVVLDGWYYDRECTDEVSYYEDVFDGDTTLYAKWINEDDGSAYTYTTLSDGTVEIRSYTGKRRYLTIPSEIEGKKVTSIGEDAFNGNTRLKSVILPSTLVTISDRAFQGCTSIRNISIPENVVSIGANAFTACVRMSNVDIAKDSKLSEIKKEAFSECGITEFCIPASLEKLGTGVFFKSTGMKLVEVADGNSHFTIKNEALYNISGDTLIYYPAAKSGTYTVAAGTREIDIAAFAFGRVTNVGLPEGLEIIGANGFTGSAVTSVTIPGSVTSIGGAIFKCCMSLKKVTFSGDCKIEVIPASAFENCCSLESFTIPEAVIKLDMSCFIAAGLKSLSFAENSNVSSIGSFAFACTPLASVAIPQSVTNIDMCAFEYCTQLTEVSFVGESSLDSIGWSVFEGTISLSEIQIPDSVKTIEYRAFYNSGLETVNIGKNVSDIGDGAFSSCQQLKSFEVNEENTHFSSYKDALYTGDKSELIAYPADRKGTYELAAETVKIRQYAFCNSYGLTDVTYNEGLKEIDSYAFTGCGSMVTPTLPSTLETIGPGSYEYCYSMNTELIIPKSVITVGWLAFYNDYDLTDIQIESDSSMSRLGNGSFGYCGINNFTVPENVSTMGQEVFVGCKNLVTVTFEADNMLTNLAAWTFDGADSLRQITFEEGSKLQYIEARACQGMYALEEIDLRNCKELSKIGNYAFEQCPKLASVMLPASVEDIGRYAFHMCRAMTSFNVPQSVECIGRYAFKGTNGINVYFKSSGLPAQLEDNWNYDVSGYYMGVKDVIESGAWKYALTEDGLASVIKYMGSESVIELSDIDGYDVVSVGSGAFKDNTSLTQITLADTLTGIYQSAFEGTSSLESIVIPAGVSVIGDYAFKGSGISSVSIGENSALSSIGRYAFAETSNLGSISIPDGVDKVRDYTFYKSGLSGITFGEESKVSLIGRYAFCKTKLTEVDIPSGVTKIDYYAFGETANLTTVNLPTANSLEIYGNAFYRSGLTSVNIPANVSYIGELCFTACPSLTAIDVDADNANYASIDGVLFNKSATKLITCPAGKESSYEVDDTVTTFAFSAFEGSKLSEIVISDSSKLNTFGYRCFYDCDNLVSINVPDGIQSIENYSFAYCDKLQTVNISENSQLGGIYKGAFYSCSELEGIYIPKGVQEIAEYAFYGCGKMGDVTFADGCQLHEIYAHSFEYSGITEFIMPEKVLEIQDYAFNGAKISKLTFNDCVAYIGEYAFADCGLDETTTLDIPETVEFIGKYAFKNAKKVESLVLPYLGENYEDATVREMFGISDGEETKFALNRVTILKGEELRSGAFYGMNVSIVRLPDTMKKIGESAFGWSSIQDINLPEGLMEIEPCTFEQTRALNKLCIPESVEKIGYQAFWQSNISEVNIPASVKDIGRIAFFDTKISGVIELSDKLENIGGGAFSGCANLEGFNVSESNPCYSSKDGILYDKDMTQIITVPCKIQGKIIIPATVKTIGDRAFAHSLIDEIEINEGLEIIGDEAFCYCANITNIIIPDSVNELGVGAFDHCNSLNNVVIGNGISVINEQTFYQCINLERISLGDNIKEIARYAFIGCEKLDQIYITENVKEIGGDSFAGCTGLQHIEVDENNEHYSSVDGIVYNKQKTDIIIVPKSIEGKVEIPYGVENITESAFSACKKMEGVVIPNSVKSIEGEAFRYCSSLSEICIGDNVSHIGLGAFEETAYWQDEENWDEGVLYLGKYVIDSNPDIAPETLYIREGTLMIADSAMCANGHWGSFKKVILPDTLKIIEKDAFWLNKHLSAVRIGNNIDYIGEGAFAQCDDLKVLDIGGKLANIQTYIAASYTRVEIVRVDCELKEYTFSNESISTIAIPYSPNSLRYALNNDIEGLSSIIITSTQEMDNSFLNGIESLQNNPTIYCSVEEGTWPDGWNHEQKVYYKNQWNQAEFYVNSFLVDLKPVIKDNVLQCPADDIVYDYLPEGAVFKGWDIDGDGNADTMPATLTEDITANAVFDMPITAVSIDDTVKIERRNSKALKIAYTPKRYTGNDDVIWSSSDESVATVTSDGTVTAVSEGTATITVKLAENDSISASCEVTVTPVQYGIKLSQNNGTVNVGESTTIEPTYVFPEDDTDVTEWSSSDNKVATVDNNGNITALKPGSVVITVSHGTYSAEYSLSVKSPLKNASISDAECSLKVGDTKELSVALEPLDTTDSTDILWYSRKTSVVRVDANGLVTAVGPGTAEVHARIGSFDMVCTFTVTAPLEKIMLNTTTGTMRLDRTKPLNVIYFPSNTTDDRTVTWSSSNDEVASVSDTGLVTAKKQGSAVITGTAGTHSATYSVNVIGLKDNATGITVTNSDNTVMDEAVNLSVDRMNQNDVDTGYKSAWQRFLEKLKEYVEDNLGRIPVTQVYDISLKDTDNNEIQPEKNVDVEIPVSEEAVTEGAVVYRLEKDGTITDMNAEYDSESGRYRFETEHFSVYVLGSKSLETYVNNVTLNITELTICPGKTATLTATLTPEEHSDTPVEWTTSDKNVATVSENGLVNSVADGTATIRATAKDKKGAYAECKITVGHSYTANVVTPTCTERGYTEYTCDVCESHYIDSNSYKDASGHSMAATASKDPTCMEAGNSAYWYCETCKKYFSDEAGKTEIALADTVIKASGHYYGEWETVKSPTCEDTGSKKRTCKTCGHVDTQGLDATGHEWNSEFTVDKEATCTEDGSKSIHCKNCEAVKDSTVIPAKGHSEVTDPAVAATCTETGLTEGKHCSVCGQVIVKQEAVPATDHDWNSEFTVDKQATYTEEGSKSIHCKHCTAVKDSQVIPKLVMQNQNQNSQNQGLQNHGSQNQEPQIQDSQTKNPQTITVSKKASKTVTYKASALKKKKASFSISAKAEGKLTYKVTKGAKYVSVSKTGKVTIKKKAKKGTYKILVTAAETAEFAPAKRYIVIKIK